MKLLKLIHKKIVFFIHFVRWRSGLFYHNCKDHKKYYKQPAPFDWYCKKCGESW